MTWLRVIWHRLVLFVLWRREVDETPPQETQPSPTTEPVPAPSEPEPVADREAQPSEAPPPSGPADAPLAPPLEPAPLPKRTGNRQQRRATDKTLRQLERARIKRDKLVVPKNLELLDTIEHHPREPKPEKPELVQQAEQQPPAEEIIVGELIDGDGQGDVLFKRDEFLGEFNFRDSILEQLDRYWVYLERMKKHDISAYDLYRQIGATLVPYSSTGINCFLHDYSVDEKLTPAELIKYRSEIKVSKWFHEHRPAFGCVAVGTDPLHEEHESKAPQRNIWTPKFMFFIKYNRPPPELQPHSGGDIYRLTVWWDRPQDRKQMKWGRPTEIGFFVSADGKDIEVLRTIDTKMVPIRCKHRGRDYHRGEVFRIPQRAWRMPDSYSSWSAQYGLDPQTHLSHIFAQVMRMHERANQAMARVTVYKDDLVAVFGIHPNRLAYFFRDRDIELKGNQRKRILHYVREHTRADGAVVPEHYRGEPEFDWAGYHVRVTIPGRDHVRINEIDIGFGDEYWREKGESMYSTRQIGAALARNISGEAPLRQTLKDMKPDIK